VQHKTANGLTFMGNYTFLKNISNAQGSDAPSGFAGSNSPGGRKTELRFAGPLRFIKRLVAFLPEFPTAFLSG
jgi:hypothetical protein